MKSGHTEERWGWAVSAGLHLLLLLIFALMQLELKPFALDFTPVQFAPMKADGLEGGELPRREAGGAPLIELPRRPMMDETSPLLRLPNSDRPLVVAPPRMEKPTVTQSEALKPGRQMDIIPSALDARQRAPIKPLPLGDEALLGPRSDALTDRIAADELFNITWEGPTRVKLAGELPEFPAGVNQAAVVRLAFEVTPDGAVIAIAPAAKGQPQLEKAAIDALRGWRFNRLDPALGTANQKGEITFKFELR